MNCPICKKQLDDIILSAVEVNYCPTCLGLWFEKDELRQAKDQKDRTLRWLDIDLWKEKEKFKIGRGIRLCPSCRLPMYEVSYDGSSIIVDICNLCEGIWLDKGEFAKIITWLKKEASYKAIKKYLQVLLEETAEIFVGPEGLRDELGDFLAVLKLLNYKLATQYPVLAELISNLPK